MSLELRPARTTDAGSVGAILSEFIDGTPWMPRLYTRAEDIGFAGMMIDRGWVTVAGQGAEIKGFIARDETEVHALYVTTPARFSGVGSALLEAMKRGQRVLRLWTFQQNTTARQFYARHGFVEVAFSDGARNDEGLPDVQMEWKQAGR